MIVVSERRCWLRRMSGRQLVFHIVWAFESQYYHSASLAICKNVQSMRHCVTTCMLQVRGNVERATTTPRTIADKLHDNPVANLILA